MRRTISIGGHGQAVQPKAAAAGAGPTASAARLFLNVREARREIRASIKETSAEEGLTPNHINVYACRRHSRVRVHCKFFERGTLFDPQLQVTLGYKCTGKARIRETRSAYHLRFTGENCVEYPLGP